MNKQISLVAVVVAVVVAGCGSSSTKTIERVTTQPAPSARTVTQTQTHTVTRTIDTRKPRIVVHNHTRTITVQHTTTVPAAAFPAHTYSGNGGETIGTVHVGTDSVIEWTNDGEIFSILDNENAVEVNSQAHVGQSSLPAGTYHDFKVNAEGNWTVKIVPQH